MASGSADQQRSEQIASSIHTYSYEAFEVAKLFVAGDDPEPLKRRARDLEARLPEVAARVREVDDAYKPDLNQVLSEASLDLDYVLAGGGRPSSLRLAHVIAEQAAQ